MKKLIQFFCIMTGTFFIITPAFSASEKLIPNAEILYKEFRFLRAEISAAHLDSLLLLLEKTRDEIENPSSDPSILEEQIAEKEKELQAPSTPVAMDKLKKDLQELKDILSVNNSKIEQLKRREESIKGKIEHQKQKLRQLTTDLSRDYEPSADMKFLIDTLSE